MDLREKIARVIVCALADHGIDEPSGELAYAEDILQIPEIKEALELRLGKGRVIQVLNDDGFTWRTETWPIAPGTPPESPATPLPKREA